LLRPAEHREQVEVLRSAGYTPDQVRAFVTSDEPRTIYLSNMNATGPVDPEDTARLMSHESLHATLFSIEPSNSSDERQASEALDRRRAECLWGSGISPKEHLGPEGLFHYVPRKREP